MWRRRRRMGTKKWKKLWSYTFWLRMSETRTGVSM
jgi:hypothetical protein